MECLRVLSVRSGGESSRIYIRQGASRVCVPQHEGTQQLRHVVRIGEEMPLWAGASGHVLLIGGSSRTLSRVASFRPALTEAAKRLSGLGFLGGNG
nr:hypothetical protein [Streptomyces sabulosicollis]